MKNHGESVKSNKNNNKCWVMRYDEIRFKERVTAKALYGEDENVAKTVILK